MRVAVALTLAALSIPFAHAASAAPVDGISIDGDRTGAADWDTTPGVVTFSDRMHPGNGKGEDDIFQSAHEEHLPAGWGTMRGKTDTGNDIGDVLTYDALDEAGFVWFYLGFTRAALGVGAFVVELNQRGNDSNGMPDRSDGDVRITFVQENGNSILTEFGADLWDATGQRWVNVPLPEATYRSKTGEGGLFAELEVDLTSAGLQPPCDGGFTQVNLRSRSSSSPSALKDYVQALDAQIAPRCKAIRVEKYDRTTGDPLAGAAFQLFEDDGDGVFDNGDTQVGSEQAATVDGNSYTWTGLEWGTYFVKESTVPAGYEMDPDANADGQATTFDDNVKKVVLGGKDTDDTTVVRFHNPQTKAGIRVEKYDAGNAALPGAKFQLFHDDGDETFEPEADQRVGEEVAANQGTGLLQHTYTWDELAYGTYFVQETHVPAGYGVDPGSDNGVRSVTLTPTDAGKVTVVEFHNPKRIPQIQVVKLDGTTDQPLSGARFRLYQDTNDNGSFDGDAIDRPVGAEVDASHGDDANTYTWSSDLKFGETYFVEETVVPVGYALDPDAGVPFTGDNAAQADAMRAVVVDLDDADDLVTVTFENPRLTSQIEVEKFDFEDRQRPLSGATFRLYRDGDNDGLWSQSDPEVGVLGTADSGELNNSYTWTNQLAWGDYLVREITPPAGYGADPEAVNGARLVSITPHTAGGVHTVQFFDVKDDPTDPDPHSTITVTKTDADNPGTKLDGAVFELYLDHGEIGVLDAEDEKLDVPEHTGVGTYEWSGLPDGRYLVREATPPLGYSAPITDTVPVVATGSDYEVAFANPQRKSMLVVTKTDVASGEQLDGAAFELRRNGVLVEDEPIHVAGSGTYTWTGLTTGEYTVTEIAPPPGYLSPDEDDIPADGTETVSITTADAGDRFDVAFQNQRPSRIVVHKYDHASKTEVDGATFELYKDGVLVTAAPDHAPGTGTYVWPGLTAGDYTVREAAPPPGYLAPDQDSLSEDDREDVQIAPTDSGRTAIVAFFNEKANQGPGPDPDPVTPGRVQVTKLDADTGSKIDGARFELHHDTNRNGVLDDTDRDQGRPTRVGTGTYQWADLAAGQYLVVEAAPPAGYLPPADDTQVVTVVNGVTASAEFQNAPKRTAIVVTKRDATTNDPIDTASFQLWEDGDGDGRLDAAKDVQVGDAKDTSGGVVSWIGLRTGTYFVEETEAPKGYELPANAVLTVVIDDSNAGGTLERSFHDPQQRTDLEVVKQDDETFEVLAGATFQLYRDIDEDGVVDTDDIALGEPLVTDEQGVVSWTSLRFGRYVVEEVAPPVGYGLPETTTMSVVLDRDNAGGTVRLVFLDPALGGVSIEKVALERDGAGNWVPSDGEVGFGDRVKYVLTAEGYGARLYRDVRVTDYVPGHDPADDRSTVDTTYVSGSAACTTGKCATSFDTGKQQVTWSLGDLRGEERVLEFVVRMPELPADPVYDAEGRLLEAVVNVAELSWTDGVDSANRSARVGALDTIRSNEVVTTIAERPAVLDTPPAERPEPGEKPEQGLPDTGAPNHSGLVTTVGSLALLLGVWLMLRSRRGGFLPQH